jgi:hypothetical protein
MERRGQSSVAPRWIQREINRSIFPEIRALAPAAA